MPSETLITERLRLRRLRPEDAERIEMLVNHPEVALKTLNIPYPYPKGDGLAFIERSNRAWDSGENFTYAITRPPDDVLIGMIGIHPENFNAAEFGYWVGMDDWGKGYATEAARRIIDMGFEELGLNRIHATYFTHNPASRRVQEKAGMQFEGVMRQRIMRDGQYIDTGMCAILREDWQAAK